jgi:hypothetical protein
MSNLRRIFVVKDQQPVGPFNDQQLAAKLASGEVTEATLACEEGANAWRPLRETLDPTLLKKTMEFRRASSLFTSGSSVTSMAQPAVPSAPVGAQKPSSFPVANSLVGPATPPRGMPAVSLIEPNGAPIKVPPNVIPSGIVTSPPVPSGAALPPPVTSRHPSARPTPAPVKLDVEEVGTRQAGASRTKLLQISAALLVVAGVAGFFLWEPVTHWWQARQEFARAIAATQAGQFEDALVATYHATSLQPDSGVYLGAWQEARRKQLERVKARAGQEEPLAHLLYARGFAQKYESALGEEGQQAMKDWIAEVEPGAAKQIRDTFSRDLAALNTLLAPHEGKLRTYFATPEQRDEAGRLHDQWLALREAYAAWDRNEPLKTVTLLAAVPEDLRKAVYETIAAKAQTLREKLEDKLRSVEEMVNAGRFLETSAVFAELDPYADWITSIKVEKQRIQMAGENFYAGRLVESVRARNSGDALTSLKDYMEFRRTPVKEDQLKEFLAIHSFRPYLARLVEYGLHPKTPSARQNYADVILVASSLPNFDDASEARSFLSSTYFEWGRQELDKGRPGPAAYLALLADKYGNAGASELFAKAREKVTRSFVLGLQPMPLAVNAPKASKIFGTQLETDAVSNLRNVLPPWIRWQESGAAAAEPEALIVIKFLPVLAEFNRRNDSSVREESGKFRFEDIIEDNPDWAEAQSNVVYAQSRLEQAQSDYQQAKAASDQNAAAAANSDSAGVAMFGAILSGVVQGVSQSGVDDARSNLNNAQSRAASTSRQVRRQNWQTVSWREVDYLSNFDTQFRVDLIVGDKPIFSRKFTAAVRHKSTQRDGGFGGRVSPMPRQEPSMDEVETALMSQLKSQVQVLGTPEFLGQLKKSLGDYIGRQSEDMDAETRANTQLSLELLWWQHPLFDRNAMKSRDLLGRFGDVIE